MSQNIQKQPLKAINLGFGREI